MFRAKQDKLTVHACVVQVKWVVQLLPDLGRKAGNIDVEIGEFRGFSGEVFERAVVPLDQGGRGDMEEVAEHEAALDEAFHCWKPIQSKIVSQFCLVSFIPNFEM